MNVLYEEGGEFRTGTVLAQLPASYQVETAHGRRTKVKAAAVLLVFDHPDGPTLLAEAARGAEAIDVDFLWQCCGADEFGFLELAREYYGREPAPVEAAAILLRLHSAPLHFHRRGRGRYRVAPPEILRAALAAAERKRREQERIAQWAEALARGQCPPEIAPLSAELLYGPDRSKAETKAFERACRETGLAPVALLRRCGLLEDARAFHIGRFLYEFPAAARPFPAFEPPAEPTELPQAQAAAFSLDDAETTEIDDAFSVEALPGGRARIGIHIAAPSLGIPAGSVLDAIARERLATAYFPGEKYTMLPPEAIALYSLDHGNAQPAVSLYLEVSPEEGTVHAASTRVERLRIVANLRHAQYDLLNEVFPAGGTTDLPYAEELRLLWRVAEALERRRGRPSTAPGVSDYVFRIEGGCVRIEARRRGTPLDKLVAELMILANTTWGGYLAEHDVAAVYRVQSAGRVRLSVHPEVHDALGTVGYAWFTSPLRRYVDLLNQRQLLAVLAGRRPPLGRGSEALLAAMRAYEEASARYEEHQRALEHYWCLRWLDQEGVREARAVVLRDNLVRFETLPLVARAAGMPELERGTRVLVSVEALDFFERTVSCRWRAVLGRADEAAQPAAWA